ncbi:MAG: hypothetical protein WDA16_03975 [Candidatus Thermoplasmatota archaeon]
MVDPRLRQRVEVVPVRPTMKPGTTNEELVEGFVRSSKLSKGALTSYTGSIRDFLRFMKHPDGREIPVREWAKDNVWAHLHFVESNYCANFRLVPCKAEHAICRLRVFTGILPAATAAKEHCAECPRFRRPMVQHRVNALSKFFKYLARVGAIPVNFMPDVVSEWWEENPPRDQADERRRNPSMEEMTKLVNGTAHPQRRAFYATSAKWWYRPNEMFLLDRYLSFGFALPEGLPTPEGFEEGYPRHPHIKSAADGGDMVYLPKKPGRPDKRQGNRWSVIDAELKPILDQHFSWWERTVRRDQHGRPTTSAMWLTSYGDQLRQDLMYRSLFHDDCLRLGLVTEAELLNSLRVWTAHCQRHFGEKLLEMHNVPQDWCNHLRGDKLKDARGFYFKPGPDDVRQKYHEFVPNLGFHPIGGQAGFYLGLQSEQATHRQTISDEIHRVRSQKRRLVQSASVRLVSVKAEIIVPRRIVAAVLFALKVESPTIEWTLEPHTSGDPGHEFEKGGLIAICERAHAALRR